MATSSSHLRSVENRLFQDGAEFDFFQAMRVLERIFPAAQVVGRGGPPGREVVRLRAHLSLSFPPSSIYEIERKHQDLPMPLMTVAFFGLYGSSGVLPRHYTELLILLDKQAKEEKPDYKLPLRDWFDLFNHRLISHFYRAWEKYRFFIPYERGEYAREEPDAFTSCLFSFVGLGSPRLRNRLHVAVRAESEEDERAARVLAQIDDLALLHYSGFFAHRPRCAGSLEALVEDFFGLPARVEQFTGQWLMLAEVNQSRMSSLDGNNQLGENVIAGERVWDVESKLRLRLGPMGYREFTEFLPDRAPAPERKAFFLLVHLVRLYIGAEFDFDVQLILKAAEIPSCQLAEDGLGPRLGWNTWICSQTPIEDAEDAVFDGEEVVWLDRRS